MLLNEHKQMIDKVVCFAEQDDRILGLALGGSYITKTMDEFSDLDFVVVTKSNAYEEIMQDRFSIVNTFGEVLSAFTGEHVGEPRLIICLYNSPLLHVDFKFVSINDVAKRIEDPIIIYQSDSCLTQAFSKEDAEFPIPDLQWIEDRFWVWIHYATTKLGRKELFQVIDFLSFLRGTVISPLILMKNGKLPRGVRKVEFDAPDYVDDLMKTVAIYERNDCIKAIQSSIDLYLELREYHATDKFIRRIEAEKMTIEFFYKIAKAE